MNYKCHSHWLVMIWSWKFAFFLYYFLFLILYLQSLIGPWNTLFFFYEIHTFVLESYYVLINVLLYNCIMFLFNWIHLYQRIVRIMILLIGTISFSIPLKCTCAWSIAYLYYLTHILVLLELPTPIGLKSIWFYKIIEKVNCSAL